MSENQNIEEKCMKSCGIDFGTSVIAVSVAFSENPLGAQLVKNLNRVQSSKLVKSNKISLYMLPGPEFLAFGNKDVLLPPDAGRAPFRWEICFLLASRQRGESVCPS